MMSRRQQVLLAVIASVAAALGLWTWQHVAGSATEPPPTINGFVFPEPRPLPTLTLVDANGAPFTTAGFVGSWSLVYFGYTYCPDVCPLALLEFTAVKQLLAARQPSLAASYYLVSVDPKRDTPKRLREYVSYFDPSFQGLTGTDEAIAALAGATETLYFVPADQAPDNYLVSHSNNVVLLNPAGDLHAILTSPHTPEQLTEDFIKLAAHYAATP